MERDNQKGKAVATYAITSGKGGVGKTNVVLNLAIALAEAGREVLILDADLGLGNLDVLLGLHHEHTLGDVLAKRCTVQEALVPGPKGVKILPADSGVETYTALNTGEKIQVFSVFRQLHQEADTILIDTASGISSNVLFFSGFAHRVVLIATPEPTSITDAYATMKVLNRTNGEQDFHLMVNRAASEEQGLEVFQTLRRAAEHFLNVRPTYLGSVARDPNVQRAVYRQQPVMLLHPDSPASRDFRSLAGKLVDEGAGMPREPKGVGRSLGLSWH